MKTIGFLVALTSSLTPGVDTFDGTSGADFIRGVAGSALGTQDQTTLNSSDVLNGGAGADTLALLLNGGGYGGGATIRNIETLQIGTNDTIRRRMGSGLAI